MSYFENCKELLWHDNEWKSYFFAECSRLAYHDGTRAKRHFKQVGFTSYKFFDVEGAQCHIAQNKDVIIVSESGIKTRDDINLLKNNSINVFLVGESLITSENPSKTLKNLVG